MSGSREAEPAEDAYKKVNAVTLADGSCVYYASFTGRPSGADKLRSGHKSHVRSGTPRTSYSGPTTYS
jgi:hypothetical protein